MHAEMKEKWKIEKLKINWNLPIGRELMMMMIEGLRKYESLTNSRF